jgi:muramoyltetrapeptide carboxypeptidase LdcA involved in peptidoglycan recycling
MHLTRPRHLMPGDRIAIVSPSWGGPAALPAIYTLGRQALQEQLGLEIVEMPNALAHADWLASHPEARAEDLHAAFKDPSIRAVIASIGGEDSTRFLPYLDLRILAANPKIFVGFSAATSIHFACMKAGIASFYGPNVMPNLAARAEPFDYALKALKRTLFESAPLRRIEPNHAGWTEQLFDFVAPKPGSARGSLHSSTGPRTLQGRGIARGSLIGGCAEVLEQLKDTPWWPSLDTWSGAILFYETYAATPAQLASWLRDFAARGILQVLNGILFGRPGAVTPEQHQSYDASLVRTLAEIGLTDLPVIANLDFGHTDPVFTLPYGAVAEMDCDAATLSLTESAVDGMN